jgi:uncharacterized cupredoxin-like copper-binding protein
MHTVAVHLAPILGAEKSKVPFYVAGALLVAWALIVSMGIGMRRPQFPGNLGGERIVIAITVALVLATTSTAVITSSSPAKQAEASTAGSTTSPPPASAPPSSSAPAGSPTATTGTPAPPSSPAAAATLRLAANPAGLLSFSTKQLTAKAGKVTIELTNDSPVEHDVAIEQARSELGSTPVFTGGSKSVTLNLEPGTYKFFCSVPGHRQAGMEGTLTVS